MRNNLDLGEEYVELTINNDENRVIRIDLNDIGIIERLNESYKKIDEFQKNNKDIEIKADGTPKDGLEQSAKILKAFRDLIEEQINYILNADVSNIVFGNKNPLSTVKGVYLWERFFNALNPYIEKVVKKEREESQKRILKYTKVIK
jgi:hypothetical protein